MTDSSTPQTTTTIDETKARIAESRADLASSVDALGDKLDLKKQAASKVEDIKVTISDTVNHAQEASPALAAGMGMASEKLGPAATSAKSAIKSHPKEAAMAAGGLVVLLKLRKLSKKHRSNKVERKISKIQHKLEKKAGKKLVD